MLLRPFLTGVALASSLWLPSSGGPAVGAVGDFEFTYTLYGHGEYTATLSNPQTGVCIDALAATGEPEVPDAVENAQNSTDTEATVYRDAGCTGDRVVVGIHSSNYDFYFRSVRFG